MLRGQTKNWKLQKPEKKPRYYSSYLRIGWRKCFLLREFRLKAKCESFSENWHHTTPKRSTKQRTARIKNRNIEPYTGNQRDLFYHRHRGFFINFQFNVSYGCAALQETANIITFLGCCSLAFHSRIHAGIHVISCGILVPKRVS